jgi:hypothetical protein
MRIAVAPIKERYSRNKRVDVGAIPGFEASHQTAKGHAQRARQARASGRRPAALSLEPEDPLALVVARRTDLIVADPATYAQLHPVRELREFHQSLSPTFPVWSREDLASDAGFEYGPLSCR